MARKSKKNLFKRGETQRYKRIRSTNLKSSIYSAQSKQASFRGYPLFILMFIFAVAMFSMTSLKSSDINLIVSSLNNQLQAILNNIRTLPEIYYFEIPKITLPAVNLPDITVSIPEVYTKQLAEIFTNFINLLNPKPLLTETYKFLNLLNKTVLSLSLWNLYLIYDLSIYLDPRPGLFILNKFLLSVSLFILDTSYLILKFVNPLPVIKKTWEIEFILLGYLTNALIIVFSLLLNIIGLIFNTLLNGVFYIYDLIINFISSIGKSISNLFINIANGIKSRIEFAGILLKPIFDVILNNLNSTVNGLSDSAKSLVIYIQNIFNQYDKYHPR